MGIALKIICLIVSFVLVVLSFDFFGTGEVDKAIYLSLISLIVIVMGEATIKDY